MCAINVITTHTATQINKPKRMFSIVKDGGFKKDLVKITARLYYA